MKKVWKYILSILLIMILATVGTIYYFLNVKTYDTADEEVEVIIETDYDIVLPGTENTKDANNVDNSPTDSNETDSSPDTEAASDKETETDNSSSDSKEGTTGSGNTNTSTTKPSKSTSTDTKQNDSSTNTNPDETTEITVAQIKDLYRPVFKSLESQANGKIDALLSRAVGEYQAKKASDESISYSYFYKKYTSAGRELEAKTDETFNYIYKALEKDLKKHGYSEAHAKDFKEQYEATKKARESALLDKAKEAL